MPQVDGRIAALPNHRGAGTVRSDAACSHGIALWPGNTLLADSEGRGWRHLRAELGTVNSWSGTLGAMRHYCLAFCLNRPARLRRVVAEEGESGMVTVLPRQFLIIPALQPSEWERDGSSDMLMLYLDHALIERIGHEVFDAGDVQISARLGATDPLLEQLALSVLEALRRPDPMDTALYVDSLATTIGAQLLRAHSRQQRSREVSDACPARLTSGLLRLRDFVDSALDEDLSLDRLAEVAGLSVHVLPRAFRRHFGTTPHQYVLHQRLLRARALLSDTDLPIAEVALTTGFSSQSHMTSALKKATGVTPDGFRRQRRLIAAA